MNMLVMGAVDGRRRQDRVDDLVADATTHPSSHAPAAQHSHMSDDHGREVVLPDADHLPHVSGEIAGPFDRSTVSVVEPGYVRGATAW
jgi:hypothetical protein